MINRRLLGTALLVALLGAVAFSAGATAKTKNGVTPLRPKAGASFGVDQGVTFKFRVRGKGTVWFHACKSKKRSRDGRICSKARIAGKSDFKRGKRTRRGRIWTYKPELFTFPGYWLHTPGTYYWQVYRISATCRPDVICEGPIQRIRVR